MRHGKRFNHLGRTASHRKAMLSNMASSLILHKRISTTVAKAKALRQYVEPLITKSKTDSTHSRRIVFSYLQDKESVKVLFDEISEKVNDRPGGYTRIIKTGSRLGDNADMCIMELVDYNELLLAEKEPKKAKTRRSRRGKKSTQTEVLPEVTAEPVSETEDVEETDMVSEPAEEQVDDVKAEIVEETVEEVKETETITAEASEEESKESSEP
ncbi:MAG: 50S ribosomal protein L17, partial [Cyclobacteriaceae bacterium]|nr:50S ribosomal protein L17 [Cyclobacteriaceae bacterium]